MFFKKGFGNAGIHPESFKYLTKNKKIESADIPVKVYIPISQSIGAPAEIVVAVGQKVEEGELIAKANGFVSANVHSSIPGTVVAIDELFLSVGKKSQVVVIELEGEFKRSGKQLSIFDWRSLSREQIMQKIKDYGIVGLGGATFPAHVKFAIPQDKVVEHLLINGAECEPFITSDHRIMIDKSEDLLEGIEVLRKVLKAESVSIGIETNKKDAIKRLKALCYNKYDIKVVPLKVKYPQGDEKQLIKAITGRIVPVNKIPLEVGVVVSNISTALAVAEAVIYDKPLIERVVTVTGKGVKEPKNLKVRIGALLKDVIDECGGLSDDVTKLIVGGPMMGFSQMDLNVPVTKGCSAIIALTEEDIGRYEKNGICINCGRCVKACSFGLMPTKLNQLLKAGFFEKAINYGLMYCKECGACAWGCPARIPLVQVFRTGKEFARKLVIEKSKEKK